jgi:predicted nucleic acid-binding protein
LILIDSNLLIYAARPEFAQLRDWLSMRECGVSLVTKIEVLGFHKLSITDKAFFESIFSVLRVFPITSALADDAITLRQRRKMSLGDSLVAVTALEWQCPLATRNTDDFLWIDGLEIIDPLAGTI